MTTLSDNKVFAAFIAAVVVITGVAIFFVIKASNEWQAWCVAQGGHVESSTSTGVGPSTSGSGGVAVTTSTTNFCLSEDGRVLGISG